MERLLTTEEVAEYLRVDVVTVRRLVNRGDLVAYRIGSEYRFVESDLESFVKGQRVTAGEGPAKAPFDKSPERGRFDKFTERARKVLSLAQEEARRLQHNYISTEHILLGIVREGEGVAVKVLRNLSVDLNQLGSKLESMLRVGAETLDGAIGMTPRARKVIELAVDEAQKLDLHYIGTEHLLLGLLRIKDGIAYDVLTGFGVDVDMVRFETIEVLDSQRAENTPPVPQEATTLITEGEQGVTCDRCGARCPKYFRYCFNCGKQL